MGQSIAWQITILAVAVLAAGFVFVIVNARQRSDYEPLAQRAYRFRAILFWVVLAVGVPATILTLLARVPYPSFAGVPANSQIVDVVGHQWYWDLSTEQVKAGQPVEFRVTSADVNHGLGIYNEQLLVVAQTQAMPGYVNQLVHTFDTPGTYRVMCLEFCGVVHHEMVSEIKVVR